MATRKGKATEAREPSETPAAAPVHRTLLHRLADSLRTQNWMAIGVEFLVVVFGVFLGLQVTNWNAALGDRRDEAAALHEIAADIRQDRQEMAAARNVALHRLAAMREVLILARGQAPSELNVPGGAGSSAAFLRVPVPTPPPLTPQERGAMWSIIVSGYYPSPSLPTFDSLISSGRVGILRDETLVRDIQHYRLVSGYLVASQNETLRPISVTVRERGEAAGLSSFGLVDPQDVARRVAANPQLAAIIESQIGWMVVHMRHFDQVDATGAALLARLEAAGVDTRG